ncbi:MAG TPA: cupin domain-containing protein [Gaiellaceae bacterium]
MTYSIFRPDEIEFVDRGDGSGRTVIRHTRRADPDRREVLALSARDARKRHAEHVQEEIFVVLEGTAKIDLGDPPERHALPTGSVCVVQPDTPLRLRNDGDEDVLFFIVGAPPEEGGADYFPDVD